MKKITNWREEDYWSSKEFILLLLLEFVIGVGFIKFIIQPLYFQWFDNELYAGTLMGLTLAITLLLGVYFIALKPQNLQWKDVGVRKFAAKYWIRIPVWLFVLIIVSVAAALVTYYYLGNSMEDSKTGSLQQNVTIFTSLIGLVSAGLISPIYEEIFYRGFMYRWLRVRMGMKWGIVISSFIFAVAHFPTVNTIPAAFASGVVFAWTYEKSGSVIPGIIIHGLFNTISVLQMIIA